MRPINTHIESNIIESEIFKIKTNSYSEDVFFETTDNITLGATVRYAETLVDDNSIGVLFMHELGSNRSSWERTGIIDSLVSCGFVCMTLDFRGHGTSTPIDDLYILAASKTALQNDIKSAARYMESNYVMEDSVILVGASIGAIAASGGSSLENIKGAVSVSPVYDFVLTTFGSNVEPSGVYYLAGENDIVIADQIYIAKDAQRLFNITANSRKIEIIPSSSLHGVTLIIRNPYLESKIVNWVKNL